MSEGFGDAFEHLFSRAMTVAYRITRNRTEAEDVAAETLARACANWSRVSRLPHRDAWVLRVAANLAIDVVRGKRRRLPRVGVVNDHADLATNRVALRSALAKLSRRQREAVALRYLADLEEAEVARALEISVGSVKTHAHRGLVRLRATLGENELLEESHGT